MIAAVTNPLSHFDDQGASRMVDVSEKLVTRRQATASCVVNMSAATLELVRDRLASKGDVIEVARLAGIMAAKRTGDLIPLCHPLGIDSVTVDFEFAGSQKLVIRATVTTTGRTGVEMEALTATSVAALTVYDMLKGVDRAIEITSLRLDEKSGGRSGDWRRNQQQSALNES